MTISHILQIKNQPIIGVCCNAARSSVERKGVNFNSSPSGKLLEAALTACAEALAFPAKR